MTKKDNLQSVPEKKLTPEQKDELTAVLRQAKEDKHLTDAVSGEPNHQVILLDGEVIGFFTPRTQSNKGVRHWRPGALYVVPKHRGKGVMENVLSDFFNTHTPGICWIADDNLPSIALFTKIGFVKEKQSEDGHWYIKVAKSALEARPAFMAW